MERRWESHVNGGVQKSIRENEGGGRMQCE